MVKRSVKIVSFINDVHLKPGMELGITIRSLPNVENLRLWYKYRYSAKKDQHKAYIRTGLGFKE